MRRTARVEMVCPVCGKSFWRYRSQMQARGARCCSYACLYESNKKGRSFITCKQCGKRVEKTAGQMRPGRGKFCDRHCYEAWERDHATVDLICAQCGTAFVRGRAMARRTKGPRVFCGRPCWASFHRGENHHAHRGPTIPRKGREWRELAEQIRERDGRCCVRCHEPERPGQSGRLQVDHIVPARLLEQHPDLADSPSNLAALCASCHAVKTNRYERRLMRGDWVAIQEFYGREVYDAARLVAVECMKLGLVAS